MFYINNYNLDKINHSNMPYVNVTCNCQGCCDWKVFRPRFLRQPSEFFNSFLSKKTPNKDTQDVSKEK